MTSLRLRPRLAASATAVLTIAGLTTVARPAAAATCDIACQLFTDTAAVTQQRPKPFASGIGGHAETSPIVWNNQYFLYYRTFVSPAGQECSIPQGIAYATSGDGGNTWTPANGGRPIAALQTVQEGQSCSQNDGVRSTWVYSPDVIADGTRLVMVFEQRDHDPNGNGPGRPRSFHSVRWVTSTEGRTWSNSTRLLAPGAVGAWDDEIGTPDIEKDGSTYVVTFHGHDSTNRIKQRRATVRMISLVQDYGGTRSQWTLAATPGWANYGIGMADMTREADGYWYAVLEAFSGASGACGRTDTRTAVGIARSADAVNWTVRTSPLLYGRDDKSCGWDMPSWQRAGSVRGFITPDDPPERTELVRWNVIAKTAPVRVTNGSELGPNRYLDPGDQISDSTSRLVMQGDGNLVLYRKPDNFVYWASDTNGSGATRALMQYDGNLVLLRADGTPVRGTATDGRPGAVLRVSGPSVFIDAYGIDPPVWRRTSPARGM
jgi:hypothetical protein